eukprot:gene10941-12102_t
MNSSCNPKPVEDVQGDLRWMSMHERFIEDGKYLNPRVVFLGDSIVMQMQDTEAWSQYFKPLNACNFGIGGDTVQNVLWRLQNGELEHVNPKVFVVLVGTNNHSNTADEIVEGIESLAWYISSNRPNAKIIIMALLPRGQKLNMLRDKISEINLGLKEMVPTIPNTYYLDADPGFVGSDGKIKASDMHDYLHLTRNAYSKYCKPIHHLVKELLAA